MIYSGYLLSGFLSGMSHRKDEISIQFQCFNGGYLAMDREPAVVIKLT